ncbi:MAG: adenylate/guanylate cyclase domain-containing protein [Firmicutes bacterium]|nr:adenylate/guanylate cyclase domain-containing protein [Bacillota bacterium]
MTLKEAVDRDLEDILAWKLEIEQRDRPPSSRDVTLGSNAATFPATVFYTDVRQSSALTDNHRRETVTKALNAFVNAAVRIVRHHGGEVRSFNGDGLLAFFFGDASENRAVVSGLKLAKVTRLLSARVQQKWNMHFDAGIGLARGTVMAAKVGIRGTNNNAMIWPSEATNFAAKLGQQAKAPKRLAVSAEVFGAISQDLKTAPLFWTFRSSFWESFELPFAGGRRKAYRTAHHMNL